jgi:hypothetical protein
VAELSTGIRGPVRERHAKAARAFAGGRPRGEHAVSIARRIIYLVGSPRQARSRVTETGATRVSRPRSSAQLRFCPGL